MKKVLIWVLHRPDRSPSQRFRFEQYLSYLKDNGYSFEYSYLISKDDDKVFYSSGNYLRKLFILIKSIWKRFWELQRGRQYDLVFVQRECFMLGTAFFERQMSKKTKLIFDFDDAIWLHAVSEGNRKLAFLKDSEKTRKIIQSSALVFAGNEYLADYARAFNSNVVIIPTTVDTDRFIGRQITSKNKICIGWSGSFTTIEHFETALEALYIIKEKYGEGVYFKMISDKDYQNDRLSVKTIPWTSEHEVEQLSEFDIGLMPLPNDEWTKGKCGLKGLSYMSMGIATVMSGVGVNNQIIKDGVNGFLANSIEEWVEKLSTLIEDPALRVQFGEEGRKTVLVDYSYESQKERYLFYFNELTRK